MPIVLRIFGEEYGNDVARNIFMDHILLDKKESKRIHQQNMGEPLRTNEYIEYPETTPIRISQTPRNTRPLTLRDVYLFSGIFGFILAIFSSIGFFPWNLIDNIFGGIIGVLIVVAVIVIYSIDKRRAHERL